MDEVRERISALLAKSKDRAATSHERSSALRMAEKLMAKHGVKEEKIEWLSFAVDPRVISSKFHDRFMKSIHNSSTVIYRAGRVYAKEEHKDDLDLMLSLHTEIVKHTMISEFGDRLSKNLSKEEPPKKSFWSKLFG